MEAVPVDDEIAQVGLHADESVVKLNDLRHARNAEPFSALQDQVLGPRAFLFPLNTIASGTV